MNDSFYVPVELKLASGDADIGRFSGYGNVYSITDDGGDMVMPGAFAGSLARLKAAGRGIPMYMQHGAAMGADPRPVGRWDIVEEDEKGLRVEGKLIGLDTETGRYNYALVKEGAMTGLSIGYRATKAEYPKKPGQPRRMIKEANLVEISIVDQPMNAPSRITHLKSIEELLSLAEAEDYLRHFGMSKTQAVAFLSQIKRLGLGDPDGDADPGPGPGDPGEAELQPLIDALQRRGKALIA